MNSPQASRFPLAVIRHLELEELDTRKRHGPRFLSVSHERDIVRRVGRFVSEEERGKSQESWERKNVVGIYVARGGKCTCVCDVSLHHTAGMRMKISTWQYAAFL